MADKKKLSREIWELRRVKTWQLVVVLILVGFVAATFLRLNNIGMVERRNAVLSADEAGDTTATAQRLFDLQRYVTDHINADTGQFDLTGQYKRDYEAVIKAASADTNPNGNVTAKADAVCRPKFTQYSEAYKVCMLDILNSYGPSPDLATSIQLPVAALYRHNFASPLWSNDFASWSVLIFILILLIIIGRLISLAILRAMLKHRYLSI